MSDPWTLTSLEREFNLFINMVSSRLDYDAYIRMLRLDGTLVIVGAPPGPLLIRAFTLFANRRSFAGSSIGGIAKTQEMLDFCAKRRIAREVEVIAASAMNAAPRRVLDSDVWHRRARARRAGFALNS